MHKSQQISKERVAWVNFIYLNAKDKKQKPQRSPKKVYLGNGIQYLKCPDHSDDCWNSRFVEDSEKKIRCKQEGSDLPHHLL